MCYLSMTCIEWKIWVCHLSMNCIYVLLCMGVCKGVKTRVRVDFEWSEEFGVG